MQASQQRNKHSSHEKEEDLIVLDETGSESENDSDQQNSDVIILDEYVPNNQSNSDGPKPKISVKEESEKTCHTFHCLQKELNDLKNDNQYLKTQLKKMQGLKSVTYGINDQPTVQIQFYDAAIAMQYQESIESFIEETLKKENMKILNRVDTAQEEVDSDGTDLLFCIDNHHSAEAEFNNHNTSWSVPSYDVEFEGTLKEKPEVIAEINDSKPKSTCFNCLGDHMLTECPQKHNRIRIAQNRKGYYSKFGGKQSSRYHIETDPRFARFQPGTITNELRQALDITSLQLPHYIYKMRLLGYPPGWLEEAEVQSSGLTMYDSEGKEVIDQENLEEGEVSEPRGVRVQYDPSKLVEYPGFNVYPESGVRDESDKLGYPPMQPHHLKSYFELHMKTPDVKPAKRKKLLRTAEIKKVTPKCEEIDMDIEDSEDPTAGNLILPGDSDDKCRFIPPLPPEPAFLPPPPPPVEPPPTSSDSETEASSGSSKLPFQHRSSPSLEDLEKQKQRLMLQLAQEEDSVQDISIPKIRRTKLSGTLPKPSQILDISEPSSQDSINEISVENENVLKLSTASQNSLDSNSNNSDSVLFTPEKSLSASKSIEFGTPVMDGVSPYNSIPAASKFSSGITEHLPFENLPDSTGKYEKLRNVLEVIRQRMNKD